MESMSTASPTHRAASANPSGRHGARSKNGCRTCRTRKVKCDETRPLCARCEKFGTVCDWDQPVTRLSPLYRRQPSAQLLEPRSIGQRASGSRTLDNPSPQGSDAVTPLTPSILDQTAAPWFPTATGPWSTSPRNSRSPRDVLSNPTLLGPDELESFEHIPHSLMVLRFGKPWRWSMLSYIHSTVARRESGVLRAFVAVASMELRSRELAKAQGSPQFTMAAHKAQTFKENASHALHLAMRDLSTILHRATIQPSSHEDLEALFAMWFLILNFSIYDVDLVQTSCMHLTGMRSLIADWFRGPTERRISSLPPAAKQLLIFICYLDVMLALGGLGDGRLAMDLMNEPPDSPVSFDRLFEEARLSVAQLWGSGYPTEELLDDIENYRPLKFLYGCQKLKLRVWECGRAALNGSQQIVDSEELWRDIEQLGHDYFDVLLLGRSIPRTDGRRVIWTVWHACLDYLGMKILYSCIPGTSSRPPWLEGILSEMLGTLHKALSEDSQHVYRYAWPLQMVLFRVTDPIHREWVQTQIKQASILLLNLGIPANPLETEGADEILFVGYSDRRLMSCSTTPLG